MAIEGLTTLRSSSGPRETMNRLEAAVKAKGMTVFAHIDVTSQQFFSRRMPYRAPIEGLYLCGAGTHPGGELTGAPGHHCARAILRDLEAQPG